MREQDLAMCVQHWLIEEGYDVYPEAQIGKRGPRADLIAAKPPFCWVIETKTSMSLQLLEQAMRWQQAGALYTSVAVPKPRRDRRQAFCWHSLVVDQFCRSQGLGLILVDVAQSTVSEVIEPKLLRHNYARSKRILQGLDYDMQRYLPGSQSKEGYSTPANRTITHALDYLRMHSPCGIDELVSSIKSHMRVRSKTRQFLLQKLHDHPDVIAEHSGYGVTYRVLEADDF